MDANTFWLALAIVLVLEGLLPFLSPSGWRKMFAQLLQMNDGQIRFFGLCCMGLGMLVITLITLFE